MRNLLFVLLSLPIWTWAAPLPSETFFNACERYFTDLKATSEDDGILRVDVSSLCGCVRKKVSATENPPFDLGTKFYLDQKLENLTADQDYSLSVIAGIEETCLDELVPGTQAPRKSKKK